MPKHKKNFALLLTVAALLFTGVPVLAQVALIQQALSRVELSKSVSYQSTRKLKELFVTDTVLEQQQHWLIRKPEDQNFGYWCQIEVKNGKNAAIYTDVFDGRQLTHMIPAEYTYEICPASSFFPLLTLPGTLKWVLSRLKRPSSKLTAEKDTMINAVQNHHLAALVYDTLINRERNYTCVDLYLRKSSGLPDMITIHSRSTEYGNGVSTYYVDNRYTDYQFNHHTEIPLKVIPAAYHLPTEKPVLPEAEHTLLAAGTIAPNWSLQDINGKKVSLTQLRGKVVMIDFFFIGCGSCMQALKPLESLHQKYKDEQVALLSISMRDKKQALATFAKNYHIGYPLLAEGGMVAEQYHAYGFPTFYFIDKEGRVTDTLLGYDDKFEAKSATIIDGLLKK